MANTWVLSIGFEKNLTDIKVGDQLIIVYCTAAMRKLCYVSGDNDLFNQVLPWGDPADPGKNANNNGNPWPGPTATVLTAVKAGSVTYTSRGPNESCTNQPPASLEARTPNVLGGYSIQVSG